MIIYKITNKITFESYIGQTVDTLKVRWKNHCSSSSGCIYIHRAIKKYGKENFSIKVLARCNSLEEMNHREVYYIKLFKTLAPNGYNLRAGGNNTTFSLDTRQRMSEARLGKEPWNKGKKLGPQSPELIEKRVWKLRGKKRDMSTYVPAFKGKKHSNESKKKISDNRKGTAAWNKKAVICLNDGIVYDSATEAAKAYNGHQTAVSRVCRDAKRIHLGKSFAYIESYK